MCADQAATALAGCVAASAFPVALGRPESCTKAAQTEDAAKGGGRDGFEGLAARGGGGQGFGQVVKFRWVHFRSLLSQGTGRTSSYQIGTRSQDSGSI